MVKRTVLIVEDDQSLVTLLSRALEANHFKVHLALDAERGFRDAKRQPPSLIILDVMLPGMDGFHCLEKLKSDPATKRIPVIILSNLGQSEEVQQALALGAADYVVKADFTIAQVIDKIKRY